MISADLKSSGQSEPDGDIPLITRPLICVVGPTATGKSALAQRLAEQLDGEVLSADSMQVYTGMDIGTGKVPVGERTVPYHGIDLVNPGEPYSVALYQRYARARIADIDARGKWPIVCGGTGLYIRGIIDGYEYPRGGQTGNPLREKYEKLAATEGGDALWRRLQAVDAESAALIHPHNTRRVIRALELHEGDGSYARQKENLKRIPQVIPAIMIGLSYDSQALNEHIDARVEAMRAQGLEAEVAGLLKAGFRDALTAPQAIGYKELVAALEGGITKEEAFAAVKTATHKYAKRQRSWFGGDVRIRWIDADSQNMDALVTSALAIVGRMDKESKGER